MLLIVGQIVRPHGLRGEVVVDVRTDEPAERFAVGSVLLSDPTANRPTVSEGLTVAEVRPHQGRLIVRFAGVDDRDHAEALRGVLLQVDSVGLPGNVDPDEYHDHELVGLVAVDADGEELGRVVAIDHAPASDLLVLRRPDGRTALVPFVAAIVPEVDVTAGRVVLTPPGGLLDL